MVHSSCPRCGAACAVEQFSGGSIEGVITLWMCSEDHAHGGACDQPAFLSAEAWDEQLSEPRE